MRSLYRRVAYRAVVSVGVGTSGAAERIFGLVPQTSMDVPLAH